MPAGVPSCCPMPTTEGGAAADSSRRIMPRSLMSLLTRQRAAAEPMAEAEGCGNTNAAPGWTSRLPSLPSLRLRRAASTAGGLPPPSKERVVVPLRLSDGQNAVVHATPSSSLGEVLRECEVAAGVPAPLLSFIVQGKARRAVAPHAMEDCLP